MKFSKLGPSLVVFIFVLSLAWSAQAQIGVYPTSGNETTVNTDGLCGKLNGTEITSIKELYNYYANNEAIMEMITNNAVSGQPPLSNVNPYLSSKNAGFCLPPATALGNINNGYFYKLHKKSWLDWSSDGKLTHSGDYFGAPPLNYKDYYDISNPLYVTWQCCEDPNDPASCEYCAAKLNNLRCGYYLKLNGQEPTAEQLCPGGILTTGPTETPVGSGKYVWSCESKDNRPGEPYTPMQSIVCSSKPDSNACGPLHNTVPTNDLINDWDNLSPEPCPPGSVMINTTIAPKKEPASPYIITIHKNPYQITLSDGTVLQQPEPCNIDTMTWQCYDLSNGLISNCASSCPDKEETPSITQPTTASTSTTNTTAANLLTQVQNILNEMLSILASLK